jgi:hypothetical protein
VCDQCGEIHLVSADYHLASRTAEAGSLDELYPEGELPAELVRVLGDLVWCPRLADWVDLDDPARVYLTPLPPSEG